MGDEAVQRGQWIDGVATPPRRALAAAGLRAGVPLAIGYVPIAMAFGLLAVEAGLTPAEGAWMSAAVFAGASQFVGVQLWAAGAGAVEIIITTFLVNLRHLLMSASLAARLGVGGGSPERRWLPAVAFGITDETFAVASLEAGDRLSLWYLAGLHLTAYLSWFWGTVLGAAAGTLLPDALSDSMGIALYAMFIGLLVPAVRRAPRAAVAVGTAAALNTALQAAGWPQGWSLVAAALAGAGAGTLWAAGPEEAVRE